MSKRHTRVMGWEWLARSGQQIRRVAVWATVALVAAGLVSYRGGPLDRWLDGQHQASAAAHSTRVARGLQDLDEHDLDALTQRAQRFHSRQSDQFVSDPIGTRARLAIDQATTGEEVLSALRPALKHYRLTASLVTKADAGAEEVPYSAADLARLKTYARAWLDVLERLPRALLDGTTLREVRFAGNLEPGPAGWSSTNGYFDQRAITVNLHPSVMLAGDQHAVIAHELAHAVLGHEAGHSGGLPGVGEVAEQTFSVVWGAPDAASVYGLTDPQENEAELFSQVLLGRIAHPDHVRQFDSPANRGRIELLERLDRQVPGLADYLLQ